MSHVTDCLHVIGYTGTRRGMTAHQLHSVRQELLDLRQCWLDNHWFENSRLKPEFHHGCCKGGDREFHMLVREVFSNAILVGHPADETQQLWAAVNCDLVWVIPER